MTKKLAISISISFLFGMAIIYWVLVIVLWANTPKPDDFGVFDYGLLQAAMIIEDFPPQNFRELRIKEIFEIKNNESKKELRIFWYGKPYSLVKASPIPYWHLESLL